MLRQMLLSLPVAIVIGLSAQVAGQENKIPDQAREIIEKEQRFLTTDSPASVFNQTLRHAKVSLAGEPGKKN